MHVVNSPDLKSGGRNRALARARPRLQDARGADRSVRHHGLIRLTEYWSVAERNTLQVPFEGVYLVNRAAVVAVLARRAAARLLALFLRGGARRPAEPGAARADAEAHAAAARAGLHEAPDFAARSLAILLARATWMNLRESVKNVYFAVIVLAGMLTLVGQLARHGRDLRHQDLPVTYMVLELIRDVFALFVLVVTTFYAGEMVWREREARMAQMMDALPVPGWLPLAAKTIALVGLQALMLLAAMVCGMGIQLAHGYLTLEPGLYLTTLFGILLPRYVLLAVLAIAAQAILNHKYLAYFVLVVYYVASCSSAGFGLDHPMLVYGALPDVIYSAMNGFGHACRWSARCWPTGAARRSCCSPWRWCCGRAAPATASRSACSWRASA